MLLSYIKISISSDSGTSNFSVLPLLFNCYNNFRILEEPNKSIYMCNFSISYPRPKEQLVAQLKSAILSQSKAHFEGDNTTGAFAFTAMGFGIAGNYVIEGDIIEVNITDKPFLVSCSKIESEIRKYLGV